jgi:hypothetical protein
VSAVLRRELVVSYDHTVRIGPQAFTDHSAIISAGAKTPIVPVEKSPPSGGG